jgi:hypothetical protein
VPFGSGAPYDLIVDANSNLYKIQIKTDWFRNGCVVYRGVRRMREASPYAVHAYRESEVDYFVIYYPAEDSIYVVPFKICCGDGCLRLHPVNNGQQKLIRWALDFTWEQHIKTLTERSGKSICPSSVDETETALVFTTDT